jgi:hypothetical protein
MALPTYLFYGCNFKVRVPPEDSDDSVLASESDEELPRRKSNTVVIPETNSDEDVYGVTAPSSTFVKRKINTQRKSVIPTAREDDSIEELHWNPEVNDTLNEPVWTGTLITSTLLFSVLDYFRMFVGKKFLTLIVAETNKYAIECNPNKPLNLAVEELEQWLGIILCVSTIKLPATRLY